MRTFKAVFVSAIAVSALSLALAASAAAQTEQGYNPVGPNALNEVTDGGGPGGGVGGEVDGGADGGPGAEKSSGAGGSEGSPAGQQTTEAGTLPFTGLDVALLLGAGGFLVLMGFGMRRLTRAPTPA